MKEYLKKKRIDNIIDNIIDDYKEPKEAIKNNAINEKILDKTIKRIIAHNKGKYLKPINTKKLISSE